MKFKLGNIVQTTASAHPPRKVGEIIEVVMEDYRVQLLAGGRFWFTESELRPYKKKSEKVKPATREEEKLWLPKPRKLTKRDEKRLKALGCFHKFDLKCKKKCGAVFDGIEEEPSCVHDWRYIEDKYPLYRVEIKKPIKQILTFYCTKCLEIVSK